MAKYAREAPKARRRRQVSTCGKGIAYAIMVGFMYV
jgi:hypothetical protein